MLQLDHSCLVPCLSMWTLQVGSQFARIMSHICAEIPVIHLEHELVTDPLLPGCTAGLLLI